MKDRSLARGKRAYLQLQKLQKQDKEGSQNLFTRYGIERFLARLAQSRHARAFILKGGTLFGLWMDRPHRPTKDIDFLGRGDLSEESLLKTMTEILEAEFPGDEIDFDVTSLAIRPIREGTQYGGHRVTAQWKLYRAKEKVQIDIGIGDYVYPAPRDIEPKSLIGEPCGLLSTYPPESVIAEKLHAIVANGMQNSRLKDFYDLDFLVSKGGIDRTDVTKAIRGTFDRRRTPIPVELPIGLSQRFARDKAKQEQWGAFLKNHDLQSDLALEAVVDRLANFAAPLFESARKAVPSAEP